MAESKLTYEQIRKKRMEENKKRMEELQINKLAQSLHASPKPSPGKPRNRRPKKEVSEVRRSSRVASLPPTSYKEELIEPLGLGNGRRSYGRKDLLNRVFAGDEERAYAIERAYQVESGLGTEFPCFIKPMLKSHVTGGFWLGLPLHFCKDHFPKVDTMITLIDEEEDEFECKYLALKNGLSAGWRGFALDHQLADGDALIFQLISRTELKVYIIRVNESEAVEDGVKDSDADKENTKNEADDKDTDAGKKNVKGNDDNKENDDEDPENTTSNRRSKRLRKGRN